MTKYALITGASRGIGQACANKLADAGYELILTGRKMSKPLAQTLTQVRAVSPKSLALAFGVADQTALETVYRAQLKKLAIDTLILNAGVTHDATMVNLSWQDWDLVIKTNLYGPFYLIKLLLPQMRLLGWGRIILISSIVGTRGAFGQTNYAAAKAGLIGLTKSLAKEVAKDQITVNAVAPGYIATDMTKKIPPTYLKQIRESIPLRRLGTATEVASVVAFLASSEAAYITGSVIDINGGL